MGESLKKVTLIALMLLVAIAVSGCSNDKGTEKSSAQPDKVTSKQDNGKKQEKKVKKPINKKIKVNDELKFEKFNVSFEGVKIYEKKGKTLADIKFQWRNLNKKNDLFVLTLFDVKQGDESLDEVNNSWDPMKANKNRSDAFFPNAAGGLIGAKFTYELKDKKTPIKIMFTPTTEKEKSETVTVNIS